MTHIGEIVAAQTSFSGNRLFFFTRSPCTLPYFKRNPRWSNADFLDISSSVFFSSSIAKEFSSFLLSSSHVPCTLPYFKKVDRSLIVVRVHSSRTSFSSEPPSRVSTSCQAIYSLSLKIFTKSCTHSSFYKNQCFSRSTISY